MISYGGRSCTPYKSDTEQLKLCKVRDSAHCYNCRKAIPPKSYCFGKQWGKLCLDCGLKTCDEVINSLNKWIEEINLEKAKVILNRADYEAINISASI